MAKVFAVRALYVFDDFVEMVEIGFMDYDKHGKVFHVISGGDDLIIARPVTATPISQFIERVENGTLQDILAVDYIQTESAQWGGIAQWDHRYYFGELTEQQALLRNWHGENLRLFNWEPPTCAC